MIEEYHSGSIIINGKMYEHDVQIFPSGQIKSWWRKTSHEVILEDVREALEQNPQIIIFGTGSPGMMGVSDEVREKVKTMGIELIIEPTKEAIKKFNELKKDERKVAGFFHLTCWDNYDRLLVAE